MKLTQRQTDIYEFIRDEIFEQGFPPSVREICRNFGIKSPNGAVGHLRALQREGLLERIPNTSRGIRLSHISAIGFAVGCMGWEV